MPSAATRRGLFAGALAFAAAPPAFAQATSVSPLLAMAERYGSLSAQLRAIPDTEEYEAHFSPEYQALDVERCTLAARLIQMPAHTDAELRAKALCAADWFEGRVDDLGDCLVASILGDLGQRRNWLEHLQASDGGWPSSG